MNSKKYEEIKELLDSLSEEEFYAMVMKANENLNLDEACTFESASEYSAKSNLNYEFDFSIELSESNDISKAA
ncbi:hypothetical protein SAMN02745751_02306 [Dethiosulfatibacter aminovorans DSM 17477]|uniref:Uncharacterized protein n=1 Tax=Dethiosulfatibacter aminovorans DSM 17477 TaxID=1121476 RepID=A0A1M6IG09_9FIRM|nr:hypothetical protein [Dethiosulfatibacter aminovorans]SHJ33368.1 hypothetical protein SAMN02745751_02306 [Dethiosulfatibacter aminovorans DSM 17477]